MPVTVIIGGQFGGEGKGKVAYFLSKETNASIVARVGGPNSGHTIINEQGVPIILRHLPTAALLPDVKCVLSAGSYIDPDILFEEISRTGISHDRLLIDPNAMIISAHERQEEEKSTLRKSIGSTLSGTGAAVRKRINRGSGIRLAKTDKSLQHFIRPVAPYLRDKLGGGKRVIIEGTQGFGLSLLHSNHYPYVTSRDTTAAAFVSEVGLSPLDIDDIVLVLRAFPIRVGGNSGPLPNEIDWNVVTKESKNSNPILEYTSVTKTVRRVARFDPDVVRQAIMVNQPTCIVLNHLDYIDATCRDHNILTDKILSFVGYIESLLERKVNYLGFNPTSLVASSTNSSKLKIS
ncbi:MAG: adenylosuccinate synthetase [Thermodesulfobacteriota bacterium]